jgi:hypothetical protein
MPTGRHPQSSVPRGQSDKVQVANSNLTLNKFLGGRRPSWMVSGDQQNSSRPAAAAVAAAAAAQSKPARKPPATSTDTQGTRVYTKAQTQESTSQTPAIPPPASAPTSKGTIPDESSMLLSPALTNEASPNAVGCVETLNTASSYDYPQVASSHFEVIQSPASSKQQLGINAAGGGSAAIDRALPKVVNAPAIQSLPGVAGWNHPQPTTGEEVMLNPNNKRPAPSGPSDTPTPHPSPSHPSIHISILSHRFLLLLLFPLLLLVPLAVRAKPSP